MSCVLLWPGTFPICHRPRARGCRTGSAFIGVRRCALTEDSGISNACALCLEIL